MGNCIPLAQPGSSRFHSPSCVDAPEFSNMLITFIRIDIETSLQSLAKPNNSSSISNNKSDSSTFNYLEVCLYATVRIIEHSIVIKSSCCDQVSVSAPVIHCTITTFQTKNSFTINECHNGLVDGRFCWIYVVE